MIFSELFGFVENHDFTHWQTIDRNSVQDLVLSSLQRRRARPRAPRRQAGRGAAFYDEFGRGMDGMQLPNNARCYKADVGRPASSRRGPDERSDDQETEAANDGPDDDPADRLPLSRPEPPVARD